MGVVSKWAEPKTAAELGRLIETFLVAEFGWGCSGGSGDAGADLDVDMDDEEATILVAEAGKLHALRHWLDGDNRFEMLDDAERALIDAHRARQDAGGPREPHASITEAGAVEGSFRYNVDGTEWTFHTWFGPASEWDDDADERSFLDAWSEVRVDGLVQAVRLTKKVVGPPSCVVGRLAPSTN